MKIMHTFAKAVATAAALSLLAVPAASADQRRGDHAHRGHHGQSYHHRGDAWRGHARHHRPHYRRHHAYRGHHYRRHHYRPRHHYRRHHYRPRHVYRHTYHRPHYVRRPHYRAHHHYRPRYHIGGYYGYHPRTVYIRDYHRYGLYAPPRGYHWVHDYDRGDAILASAATGAIIGLVIGAIAYD